MKKVSQFFEALFNSSTPIALSDTDIAEISQELACHREDGEPCPECKPEHFLRALAELPSDRIRAFSNINLFTKISKRALEKQQLHAQERLLMYFLADTVQKEMERQDFGRAFHIKPKSGQRKINKTQVEAMRARANQYHKVENAKRKFRVVGEIGNGIPLLEKFDEVPYTQIFFNMLDENGSDPEVLNTTHQRYKNRQISIHNQPSIPISTLTRTEALSIESVPPSHSCPNCSSTMISKNGRNRDKVQRFKCNVCGNNFQSSYTYKE